MMNFDITTDISASKDLCPDDSEFDYSFPNAIIIASLSVLFTSSNLSDILIFHIKQNKISENSMTINIKIMKKKLRFFLDWGTLYL